MFPFAQEAAGKTQELLSSGALWTIVVALASVVTTLAGVIWKLYGDVKEAKAETGAAKDEQLNRLETIIPAVEKSSSLMDQVVKRLERNKDDDSKLLAKQIDLENKLIVKQEQAIKTLDEVKTDVRTLISRGS